MSYDLNGNLIRDIDKSYEYNSLNQLVKVKDLNGNLLEEYFYDHNSNRIKKIEYKAVGTQTTYYLGDLVRVRNSSGTFDTLYYYDDDGILLGRRDPNGKLFYYYPDHLGSTDIVTDQNGNVVEDTSYQPYGEIIEGGQSKYTFTGKEKDSSGLMYFGARYYSPSLKHFTQPDTIIQDVYDPQNLNRYSYVRNNPVNYVDPTGNLFWVPLAMAVTYVLSVTSPYWAPYVGSYFAEQSIESIKTAYEDPSPSNLIWAGLGAWDLATPGIPESGIAKKAINKGRNVINEVKKTDNIFSAAKKAKPDFYVKPSGESVPSKAYSHIRSTSDRIDKVTKTKTITPNLDDGKTWFTFNKIDYNPQYKLRTKGDAMVRAEFNTLQIIDDLNIPLNEKGRLQPYVRGINTQATTSSNIIIDDLTDLRKISR